MYERLDVVFGEHPDLSGVFAVSSVGNKIVDYFSARNKKKNIAIIGYDLSSRTSRVLKNGAMDCLISQRPEEQAGSSCSRFTRKSFWRRGLCAHRHAHRYLFKEISYDTTDEKYVLARLRVRLGSRRHSDAAADASPVSTSCTIPAGKRGVLQSRENRSGSIRSITRKASPRR
jgi:hypothetical protein